MPLYEYKCKSCGKKFEVIQKFADEPLKTHPECGGEVEKLFSAPAFHLKGTGWYATDYAKGNGVNNPKPEDSKSHDSKSGDSKPAETGSKTDSSANASDNKVSESKPTASEAKPAAPASDSK